MLDYELGLEGHLEITSFDKRTNEETVLYSEKNVIVNTGYKTLVKCLSALPPHDYSFGGLYFGDDVGGGSLEVPEEPDENITPAMQNVLFRVPDGDISFRYPTHNQLQFVASIDGDVISREAPDKRYVFSSASLRNKAGELFAYKRFPSVTTSPFIGLNMRWTITILPQCPSV